MNTMYETQINGRVIHWDVSCRTADDWYAQEYDGKLIADHLPNRDAAVKAGVAYYNALRAAAKG